MKDKTPSFIEELKALLKKDDAIIGIDKYTDMYIRVGNEEPKTLGTAYIDHKNLKL